MGASVQIECQSDEISSDYRTVRLDWHPTVNNLLQAVWKVTAEKKTPATGIRVTVGPIRADATFEVFEDEKERYAGIKEFCFSSKRYKISSDGKRKRVTLYCPLELVSGPWRLSRSSPPGLRKPARETITRTPGATPYRTRLPLPRPLKSAEIHGEPRGRPSSIVAGRSRSASDRRSPASQVVMSDRLNWFR